MSAKTSTCEQLEARAKGILDIPANEQCIGHFQIAVSGLLQEMIDHIHKLEKVIGIECA